jgi:hypothetical protein
MGEIFEIRNDKNSNFGRLSGRQYDPPAEHYRRERKEADERYGPMTKEADAADRGGRKWAENRINSEAKARYEARDNVGVPASTKTGRETTVGPDLYSRACNPTQVPKMGETPCEAPEGFVGTPCNGGMIHTSRLPQSRETFGGYDTWPNADSTNSAEVGHQGSGQKQAAAGSSEEREMPGAVKSKEADTAKQAKSEVGGRCGKEKD